MITILKNIYSDPSGQITLDDIISLIRDNDSKQITSLRSLEKSKSYNKVKSNLPVYMPHGIFSGKKSIDLISLSGFLFYDIDNLSTDELKSVKTKLIELGANIVYVSPGGRGLHFLFKVNGLCQGNFISVYETLRDYLIDSGVSVDMNAGGLARKAIISSDKDIYYNEKSIITLHNKTLCIDEKVSLPLNVCLSSLNNSDHSDQKKEKKEIEIRGNDTFFVTPISILKDRLIFRTPVHIQDSFKIKDIEYVSILVPKIINDGDKHKFFRRIIIDLIHLNPNITPDEVYSYIYWINDTRTTKKMEHITLQKFVSNMYIWVRENDVKPFMKTKKIHISNDYSSNEKAALGGKINAMLRQNETIKKIIEARHQLKVEGKKETRVEVAKMTELSIITVKRNWNKELNDINDIELPQKPDDKQLELDYKLSQLVIDEDDWFKNWKPIPNQEASLRGFD